MKIARFWIGTLAIAAAFILLNVPAHADIYKIYDLTDGYRTDLIGITANGTVVLDQVDSGILVWPSNGS